MAVGTEEWTDTFAQVRHERAGRLEVVNKQLGDFVRAYDAWVIAQGQNVSEDEWRRINAELDRQYELLDALGSDRP